MKKFLLIFACPMFIIGSTSMWAQTGISDVNFTPRSILHAHLNAASGNLLQLTNSTTGNGSNAVGFTIYSNGNDYSIKNNQNGYLNLFTNGTERLRILPNGNVGIGTTSPSYSLQVNGSMGVVGNAVFSGGYVNFGSTAGILGYGFRDSSGVLEYKHSSSASWTPFSLPPSVPGNTEWWIRPTSALYIQPMANANIRVYDAAQTYGLWYDGSSNQYAIYARTSSASTITSAVTGFSDVSGNQTYGYLGYQGDYTFAGQTINGSAVYGVVDDPGRTAGFFRTTGNADNAANINYSNTWIANYNYVENSSATYNPSASYSQLDVSSSTLGGAQVAVKGYSLRTSTSGNNGYTIGGYFTGDGVSQDSYGVKGVAIATSGSNIGGYFTADATTSTDVTPSVGVYAESADIDAGIGVMGVGNGATASVPTTGAGGLFAGNSYGVYSKAVTAANGTGVTGIGNNTSPYGAPNSAGAGGVFCGNRYGTYSTQNATTAGTGYEWGLTYAGLIADATASANNAYHFGVHGKAIGAYRRTGGVLGTSGHATLTWGSLGYISSAGTNYGGYGTTAWTSGGGKSTTGKSGVAFGGYGDLYGSWFRGEVYGMAIKGERYGLYVDGKQYTNDIIAVVSPSESKGTKTATYVQTSMSVDVYAKGTATLTNGETHVQFDPSFSELVSTSEEVIVTITPIGRSASLYIDRSDAQGFVVKEDLKSNGIGRPQTVKFTWIAVGTKKGYETPQNPEEVMQNDYDQKLDGFMFNENETTKSATPMWWDGTKIRYDEAPAGQQVINPKEEQLIPKTTKEVLIDNEKKPAHKPSAVSTQKTIH
jgi:hypothetical protein